ncbi:MAG: hypothetical protein JWR03_2049 [Cohnella sp.]|nr:hypothetical protein [Cohnella sp.]
MMWPTGRRLLRIAAGVILFIGCIVICYQTASAAGSVKPAAAYMAVGSLPLLAALGIGIAIAVGAVVAFLQMTAKGRDQRQTTEWNQVELASASEQRDHEESANYTIPLGRIYTEPAPQPSETAEEGQPRLCGVEGEFAGTCFRINGQGLSIGRDPALCSIVFPQDVGEVSRRHCTLQFEEGRQLFLLEDHGSSNGTFLQGGERLEPGKRYELRSGERFALSGTVHWFEVRE